MADCCKRHKIRDDSDKKKMLNRLKRIEGQIRGLEKMVEDDCYCPDILVQAQAANSALNSFCKSLLKDHIRTCVREDVKAGKDESIDELLDVLSRFMK